MDGLRSEGKRPYYIYGDCTGHGTEETGNRAYEKAYLEIRKQEELQGAGYDYIFLASGTGATQAGLIRGQQQYGGNQAIVGISIARDRETGMAAIRSRLPESDWDKILSEGSVPWRRLWGTKGGSVGCDPSDDGTKRHSYGQYLYRKGILGNDRVAEEQESHRCTGTVSSHRRNAAVF